MLEGRCGAVKASSRVRGLRFESSGRVRRLLGLDVAGRGPFASGGSLLAELSRFGLGRVELCRGLVQTLLSLVSHGNSFCEGLVGPF